MFLIVKLKGKYYVLRPIVTEKKVRDFIRRNKKRDPDELIGLLVSKGYAEFYFSKFIEF